MIKVKLHIVPSQDTTYHDSSNFKYGKLYKCIASSEFHPKYMNCIAWKSRDIDSRFNLKCGNVYVVLENSDTITRATNDETGSGLDFVSDYKFQELPEGSYIELTMEEKLIVP